ncbi:MAG: IPT/TIG domain-containing protein, partial [Sulfobacillus sp.]
MTRNKPHQHTRRRIVSALAVTSAALLWNMMSGLPALAATGPTINDYTISTTNGTTIVTINGQNLGTDATGAAVTFGSISAPIDSWSDTSIEVTLPQNAGPGPLVVTTSLGTSNSIAFSGIQRGYYTLSSNGTVTATGDVQFYGDLSTINVVPTTPAIELVPTPSYQGYWILTQNGQVYSFGDAASFNNLPSGITAVGMAPTPSGQGAFLLSNTGSVYALGSAVNYGNAPSGTTVASIAATPDGLGYWILGINGTVYPFGDAQNYGNQPEANSMPTT